MIADPPLPFQMVWDLSGKSSGTVSGVWMPQADTTKT